MGFTEVPKASTEKIQKFALREEACSRRATIQAREVCLD
jgi:hypothetical protein